MYLVSVYFDEKTNKQIQRLIDEIAQKTGNDFMTKNHVPPHLTISQIEARSAEVIRPGIEALEGRLKQGDIWFASVGQLFPYVIYMMPVLNAYLQELSVTLYETVRDIDETTVNRFYKPMQWLPHVTLGKTLSKEQMQIAFTVLQEKFVPFTGKVMELGLAKTNPHEDVFRMKLI